MKTQTTDEVTVTPDVCPQCDGRMMVRDGRRAAGGTFRRRRQCNECGRRSTTYEREALRRCVVCSSGLPQTRMAHDTCSSRCEAALRSARRINEAHARSILREMDECGVRA